MSAAPFRSTPQVFACDLFNLSNVNWRRMLPFGLSARRVEVSQAQQRITIDEP